jgi:hypothetical protein
MREMIKFGLNPVKQSSPKGFVGYLKVSQLRPTQSAVGKDETNYKIKKMTKRSRLELKDYLTTRPVPVIIGNGGKFYIIDHHHLTYSLWNMGKDKNNKSELSSQDTTVVVEVQANWTHLTGYFFWKAMNKNHWAFFFNADGGGPIQPDKLPSKIEDLANDPYRSLAWYVRNNFGYFKDPNNAIFAEFKWGVFFRDKVQLGNKVLKGKKKIEQIMIEDLNPDNKKEVIDYALALARSPAASELPGYQG